MGNFDPAGFADGCSLNEMKRYREAEVTHGPVAIGIVETSRAQNGWVPPAQVQGKQFLNDDYYPGDINFDPLGLKPTDAAEFAEMQTKELQNGRLAMLASMGFIAQELVNHVGIVANLN